MTAKTPPVSDTWLAFNRNWVYVPEERAGDVLLICEDMGVECKQLDPPKGTPKGYAVVEVYIYNCPLRNTLRQRVWHPAGGWDSGLLYWVATDPKWSNLLHHTHTEQANPVVSIAPASARILDIDAASDAIALEMHVAAWQLKTLYRRERELCRARGLLGRVREVAGAVNAISFGAAHDTTTLETMKARASHAAKLARRLCQAEDQPYPDLQGRLAVIFGACHAVAYATSKASVMQAYTVSMREIAWMTNAVNRLIHHLEKDIHEQEKEAA